MREGEVGPRGLSPTPIRTCDFHRLRFPSRLLRLALLPTSGQLLVADIEVRAALRALLHRPPLGGREGSAAAALLAHGLDRWVRRLVRGAGGPQLHRAALE